VSQHSDLEFRLGRHVVVRTDQTEDPAQEEIEKRADHGAAFSQTGRRCWSQHAIVFLDPTMSFSMENDIVDPNAPGLSSVLILG